MESIQIIPMGEEHIEGFHACYDVVAREGRYLGLLAAPPVEAMRSSVLAHIAKGNPQLAALDAERVVGWCSIIRFESEGFLHRGRLGMGLYPEYRGQGIGRKLVAAAVDNARQIGLERVELAVFASNERAVQLYRKMGFETEGLKRNARKIGGEYDDLMEMVLVL